MAFKHKTFDTHYHDTADEARECEDYLTAVCEHGMAAWLCEGPQHYWMDDMERQARGW